MQKTSTISLGLLFALALLTASGPFSIDLYLPGLPQVAAELATSKVQWTLSSFMLGMACGQLGVGALSDTYGRKRFLIAGAGIALVAAIGCAFAPSIGMLISARFFQGIGAGMCVVLARSVIPDLMEGVAAAKAFSWMMIVGGIAPALAPVVGAFLIDFMSWRGIFLVLVAIAFLQMMVVIFFIPETRPPSARTPFNISAFSEVARNRTFLFFCGSFALGFGTLFSYISSASIIIQQIMGYSPKIFALVFAINSLGLMSGGFINTKLLDRYPPSSILRGALVVVLLAVGVLSTAGLVRAHHFVLFAALFFAIAPLSVVMGNATTIALGAVRARAGSASALLGCGQFLMAGLVSAIAPLGSYPPAMMVASMAVCATGALCLSSLGRRSISA
ncbi:multidrug effflux MFS transporter [Corynebacterium sp. ES2794-CONJ1]|uniref:multidrug effflux MFS transporter n=1 Tax=unclassified Corynebacterium TaxID=2624378 RepID=UPI00216A0503|nr:MULTISPECIES: multidrug effflux MFS transporter [unclassified Corynebacterium]MCS4490219.1 multidrug effflux MFS transporter [Corynebacterium sp. ES2775-CONJ]MCS4491970.1 multidrug effflux MFS transporter [Corynebacterium sp. ES2715-CONJ3]MCS4532074.1 multidrug effflux MFS transporter [Corynebacterium sp. ES2730-CONJ]MCU9519476.1 multidrug effflux MFS transporter [Corynebacterium sp. ES2794-CONJ1]